MIFLLDHHLIKIEVIVNLIVKQVNVIKIQILVQLHVVRKMIKLELMHILVVDIQHKQEFIAILLMN